MERYYFPFGADNRNYYKCKAWIPTKKQYKKARFRKALQRGLEWDKQRFM